MIRLKGLFFAFILVLASTSAGKAQMPSAGIPQFLPAGEWSVEPSFTSTSRDLGDIKMPCLMVNRYDNGYVLRLSGGGGALLAMAIDFKQGAFHQGRKYNAAVRLPSGQKHQVRATAFSKSVLVFNLRSFSGFYQSLQQEPSMIIDVEGNAFQFALGNLPEAIQRLESCFGGRTPGNTVTGKAVTAPVMASAIPRISKAPVTGDVAWNEKVTNSAVSSPPTRSMSVSGAKWRARAGDDLRQTLERWANQAGVSVDWQSTRGGQVVSDVNVQGTFNEAVQTLMAQNAAVAGLDANLMRGGEAPAMGNPHPLMPPAMPQPISHAPPPAPVGRMPSMAGNVGWNAPSGSNLQQVLAVWSQKAGVELIWQSNQNFTVRTPVNNNGGYEAALQELLNQFVNDKVRPAAQLNNDPTNGKRVLIIQSSRVL